jgi:hypothetical protein
MNEFLKRLQLSSQDQPWSRGNANFQHLSDDHVSLCWSSLPPAEGLLVSEHTYRPATNI